MSQSIESAPVNVCRQVKCGKCGKTTWATDFWPCSFPTGMRPPCRGSDARCKRRGQMCLCSL
ncbi:hypothetical protein BDZ94DRAFT_1257850, partial [Collybia nuda]